MPIDSYARRRQRAVNVCQVAVVRPPAPSPRKSKQALLHRGDPIRLRGFRRLSPSAWGSRAASAEADRNARPFTPYLGPLLPRVRFHHQLLRVSAATSRQLHRVDAGRHPLALFRRRVVDDRGDRELSSGFGAGFGGPCRSQTKRCIPADAGGRWKRTQPVRRHIQLRVDRPRPVRALEARQHSCRSLSTMSIRDIAPRSCR